jgi:hypothetical protein
MVTIVTAWYNLKNKFNKETYGKWMDNFLLNVASANIVIYTNKSTYDDLAKYADMPNIKIILKELEEFYTYKDKNNWISNHSKNNLLKDRVAWELNMLWSEKINFVKDAHDNNHFPASWYIWCDIGYFRGRHMDLSAEMIKKWPNPEKINKLDVNKVHYAYVGDNNALVYYNIIVNNKNSHGLPKVEIPPNIISVAGGFFVINKTKLAGWHTEYYKRLELYFKHKYLVKDDQIILIDCILTKPNDFQLHFENQPQYDNWFMFQRLLL